MATAHIETTSDTSAFSPTAANLIRWPVYATKEECIIDILAIRGGGAAHAEHVAQRLSNTDVSGAFATDKGSRVN